MVLCFCFLLFQKTQARTRADCAGFLSMSLLDYAATPVAAATAAPAATPLSASTTPANPQQQQQQAVAWGPRRELWCVLSGSVLYYFDNPPLDSATATTATNSSTGNNTHSSPPLGCVALGACVGSIPAPPPLLTSSDQSAGSLTFEELEQQHVFELECEGGWSASFAASSAGVGVASFCVCVDLDGVGVCFENPCFAVW